MPPRFRDPNGHWYGISMRARVVYASKERVKQDTITYEELADPKWKGKICIRSGQHIYNNALFAAYVAKHGEAKAEEWLKGVKANLAQKPSGGDRETARDIAAGKCDIGIANTYYWALMNNVEADKKPWAEATKVILPTFAGGGTHVNLSGVVLAKHAPNKANAMKLIEWLADDKAQQIYADYQLRVSGEAGVAVNPTIAGYGKLIPIRCRSPRSPRTARPPRRSSTRSASTTDRARRQDALCQCLRPPRARATRSGQPGIHSHATLRDRGPLPPTGSLQRLRSSTGVVVAVPVISIALAMQPAPDLWPHLLDYVLPRATLDTALLLLGVGALATALGVGAAWIISS